MQTERKIEPGKNIRVLLVEPILFIHSIIHFRAALASFGFENASFTILTSSDRELYRNRVLCFGKEHPNVTVRLMENPKPPGASRVENWKIMEGILPQVEGFLRKEKFDFVIYTSADLAIPFFALPGARRRFPAHFATGVRLLVFRNHGFRPEDKDVGLKEHLKAWIDRFILGRAVRNGAIRKIAFFDHSAMEEARRKLKSEIPNYGIDPIEIFSPDAAKSREKLHIPADHYVSLLFGSISARKGVVETLEILAASPMIDGEGMTIVLAGPVEPSIRERLLAAVEKVKQKFNVIFHEGFIPDESVRNYFAAADCVICAYKEFTQSSGILLLGSSCGKPAIVSREGVMADVINKYHSGEAVSLNDPADFAEKFMRIAKLNPEERARMGENALNYARTMDERLYMTQFLGAGELNHMGLNKCLSQAGFQQGA